LAGGPGHSRPDRCREIRLSLPIARCDTPPASLTSNSPDRTTKPNSASARLEIPPVRSRYLTVLMSFFKPLNVAHLFRVLCVPDGFAGKGEAVSGVLGAPSFARLNASATVERTGKGENGERGREDSQVLGRALVANSLCRGQGKHTMLHEQ
jgi:hypothetical protein